MIWEKYVEEFSREAKNRGLVPQEIEKCLNYAKKLHVKNLPIIYDQVHLSSLVGYKYSFLIGASNSNRKFYRRFRVKKKGGGSRKIAEPLPNLKEIQRWILDNILETISIHSHSKAYQKKKSIRDNARFHRKQSIVLSLDIKDFFWSLKKDKVVLWFIKLGYSNSVAIMLANLCCLNGSLPQGAPTSPALSNLLLDRVDKRIEGFRKKLKIRYTRYADDMTFSGDFNPGQVISFVSMVLADEGLELNKEKIRTRKNSQRQVVTGIVVNEKLQVAKPYRKNIRQEVYYIKRFGLSSHLSRIGEERANYIPHLLGKVHHALHINPKDLEMRRYAAFLKKLL